jgi:uncharacterized protein Yka (UPF0111/DUF47 family)
LYIVILRSTIVMAREGLLGWFEKRRRSKTLTIAHRQMTLAIDTVSELERALAAFAKILVDAGETLPQEVVDEFVTIGTALRKEAMAMGHCIEMIGVDPAKVRDAARNVDFFEAEIDDRYVFIKMRLVQHSKTMSAALLVAVWDLVDYIERAADVCVQTADYLRTLAAAESTG